MSINELLRPSVSDAAVSKLLWEFVQNTQDIFGSFPVFEPSAVLGSIDQRTDGLSGYLYTNNLGRGRLSTLDPSVPNAVQLEFICGIPMPGMRVPDRLAQLKREEITTTTEDSTVTSVSAKKISTLGFIFIDKDTGLLEGVEESIHTVERYNPTDEVSSTEVHSQKVAQGLRTVDMLAQFLANVTADINVTSV